MVRTKISRLLVGIVTLAPLVAHPAAHAQKMTAAPAYHKVATITLGGDGFWDYLSVDPAAHRLYVTRGTHVQVIDTVKNKVVGDIPNTPGVHGVAIAAKLGKGFTSNGRENTVTVFDLKTLKELGRVKVGTNPDAILYEPVNNRVFTFNGQSNDVTAVDAKTGTVLGTIPVGGKPEFCASDEKGMIYANIEDTSEVIEIDGKALTVKHRWSIAPGDGPSGLAFDPKSRRVFSVCGNKLMTVLDADTGKIVATPTIGDGPDAAVFDPTLGLAISSNGQDGTMTLVKMESKDKFSVVGTVATSAARER